MKAIDITSWNGMYKKFVPFETQHSVIITGPVIHTDYEYELKVIPIEDLKCTRLVMHMKFEDMEATAYIDLMWEWFHMYRMDPDSAANEFRVALRRLEEENERFIAEVGP